MTLSHHYHRVFKSLLDPTWVESQLTSDKWLYLLLWRIWDPLFLHLMHHFGFVTRYVTSCFMVSQTKRFIVSFRSYLVYLAMMAVLSKTHRHSLLKCVKQLTLFKMSRIQAWLFWMSLVKVRTAHCLPLTHVAYFGDLMYMVKRNRAIWCIGDYCSHCRMSFE